MMDEFRVVSVLLIVVVALLNLAAHWFPWRVLPWLADDRGMMRRVPAYAYGTLTILLAMFVRVWVAQALGAPMGGWSCVWFNVGLAVAAGASTALAYLLDEIAEGRAAQEDVRAYDEAD